jgi:hypothetical protein
MKSSVDHEVVKKTKHGMVTILKAGDPVVKFIRRQASAVSYDRHPTRRKVVLGFEIAVPVFFGGIIAGISWMRRRRSS